ncbi:MAG: hypothetical protein JWM66_733 [Solirubrobacterales bacterium]|jgi:antitoxin (DNA-binding transcriptional repressor) of toxin-antitoxin stability system|nr:hypothetical protein [Solirubrobacterales bacterium]
MFIMNDSELSSFKPLMRLLDGVNPEVFGKDPQTIGLRDLQRDMSGVLKKLQATSEYRVLTNRGAPSFLLVPLDRNAWTSLLAAAPPQTEHEVQNARYAEATGERLPHTEDVVASLDTMAELR